MDGRWPDECYEQASPAVALACLELLTDEARWIHRRVETIDLLAQELVRRQVSVDFTLPEPLLGDLRIGPGGPWCVPLAILEKRPLRNFDLREHDEWRSVLGASSGGPIAAGVVTAAARLACQPDELLSTDIERAVDRASLHAPRVALDAEPLLVTAIYPERADLPTLAFATSAVTALLLLIGAAVGDLGSPTAGSSVALLLAGSVLFATTVARSGEHRLVRGIFAGPRWLLSIVAVAALAAAASVAFGANDGLRDVIWYSAGALSLVACLSLAVGFSRAASLTRRPLRSGADEDLRRS